ncbi:MAG: hypothetical protein QE271_09310 [Bacteriovoracaceae bacterium]|nr:hypothetical protein [Bacteriovoracaceae bacterium]
MKKIHSDFETLDLMIRSSDAVNAKKYFFSLVEKYKHRDSAVILGSYARRLRMPQVGLEILRPYVRPTVKNYIEANEGETAEYSGSLLLAGLITEGLQLLADIKNPNRYPKIFLIQALSHISRWDYQSAYFPLQQMLNSFDMEISDHDRIVASVNLAEVFIFLHQPHEAEKLINILIKEVKKQNLVFTYSKCLELLAECEFHFGSLTTAKKLILRSMTEVKDTSSPGYFFKSKLLAMIESSMYPENNNYQLNFKHKITEAMNLGHFESVRDLWINWGRIYKNEKILEQSLYGTSLEGFSAFYERKYSLESKKMKQNLIFHHPIVVNVCCDETYLKTFSENQTSISKNVQSLTTSVQLMIYHLSKDIFRPPTIYDLFNLQYGGEYFSKDTSLNKTQQMIYRVRASIVEENLPFDLLCVKGRYFLKSKIKNKTIKFELNTEEAFELQVRGKFGTQEFSRKSLKSLFIDLSLRTINREIDSMLKKNIISKVGSYKKTRYVFAD